MKKRIGWVLVLGLLAAACGGGDDAEPTAAVERGGILKYGANLSGAALSGRLDPALSTSICDTGVMHPIYDTLVHRDSKSGELSPGLAESWRIVDSSTVELTVRNGAVFHDGKPVDAAAVKAGLEHNLRGKAQTGTTLQPLIASIDRVDDRKIRIRTKMPAAASIPVILSGREGMIIAPGSAETADTKPVGAGPFRFESQAPGERISLRRFDRYWDGDRVKLGGVDVLHTEGGPPQVSAMLAGDLDATQVTPDLLSGLRTGADIDTVEDVSQSYYKLNWNLSRAPFSRKEFRQALNHAVDREAILKAVFEGKGEVAWGPFPSGFPGYNPSAKERYPRDLAKARELLRAAGAEGARFTAFVPPTPLFLRFGEILQQNFAEIGVTMRLQQSTDIVKEYFTDKKNPATVILWPPRPDPVETLAIQFAPGSFNNTGNYSNPRLNRNISRARGATSAEARAEAFRGAMGLIVEEALDLPVAFQPLIHAVNTARVGGELVQNENCQGIDFTSVFMKRS